MLGMVVEQSSRLRTSHAMNVTKLFVFVSTDRTTESTGTDKFGIGLLARQDVSNSTDSTDTTNSTPITTFLSCVEHQSSQVLERSRSVNCDNYRSLL